MHLILKPEAEEDFAFFARNNPSIAMKIKRLLDDVLEHPTTGIGKPEPLKYKLSGCWSRRINREHRLVYRIEKDAIVVLSCRYHYV